jgi:DNA-binding response OmpR family regulator
MDDAQITPKGIKILIVEDEHFISELYTRALTKAGYEVKVVIDGEEGLKEAQTDKYDVILLDIMIPNLTGTEILSRLRSADAAPIHSKVIIATNLEQGEEGRAAVEQKADGYIVKAEMTPRQLVEFLDQLHIEAKK